AAAPTTPMTPFEAAGVLGVAVERYRALEPLEVEPLGANDDRRPGTVGQSDMTRRPGRNRPGRSLAYEGRRVARDAEATDEDIRLPDEAGPGPRAVRLV